MMQKEKRKRCYLYTRVSTAAQTEGFSLEAQTERLHEYAEYRNLEIADEYCDAGKSGKDIKGRPAFQQMMEDIVCQKDNVSYVVVFKLSRFGRNAADILKSIQLLMDYGIDLVSVEDAIDSSTQGGRLTLAILSAVAEIERENIIVQFMAGKMQKIMDGKWAGGGVPYGYCSQNKELVMVKDEAEIVRLIYKLYLQEGMAATSVVSYLNENGYVRRKNDSGKERPFTYNFVTGILDNPFYCGRLLYNRRTNKKGRDSRTIKRDSDKVFSVQGVHEPIIKEAEWESVQKKREKLSQRTVKADAQERISLLSGLVKCPVCGTGMIATKSRRINKNKGGYYKTIHYYACNNSRKANGRICPFRHTYNQEKLDAAVFEIIRKTSGTPEFKNAVIAASGEKADAEKMEQELKKLRKKLSSVEMRKRKLGKELDNLDVFDEAYEKKYDSIQSNLDDCYDKVDEIENKIAIVIEKIQAAKKGVRAAANIEAMLDHFDRLYDKMSCEERRQMYRLFIERIEVFPEEKADGRILKSISFRFSVPHEEEGVKSDGTETAICFTRDCARSELTAAEAKATYAEIKKYIKDTFGANVHTLYIAQIKRKYGLDMGKNYNLSADPKKRVPQCPKDKEKMLLEALKHFKMLDASAEIIESENVHDEG